MSDSSNNPHPAHVHRQRLLWLSTATMAACGVTVVAAILAAILAAAGDDRGGHAVAVLGWSSAAVLAALTLMLLLVTVRVLVAVLDDSAQEEVESFGSRSRSQEMKSDHSEPL